jgi:Ca2+-binding EF-hand superfamily protein
LGNLPAKIIPEETRFGIESKKDISAAILVNPPKSRFEVEDESNCCRQMYRMTHGEFKPGEQICRNYGEPFSRQKTFGIPTPCDIAGRWCKKIMSTWRSCEPDPPYVNKAYADHLDMRYPKLGRPQDAQCIARTKGDCHTYGSRPAKEGSERPIREIIFNRCPNPGAEQAEKMMHNLKSWLEKLRKSFKSEVGPDLEALYEAFLARDEERNGTVDWDGFMKSLREVHLPCLENKQDFMEALTFVNIYHPLPCNKLNYYSLMDYIKGHQDPMFFCKTTTLKPYYLPWTNGCIHFRTTYSDFASVWCLRESCLKHLREQKNHGMPSVRTDRVPRKIRGTRDTTNYGDDGDAYSLIFPSVYTLHGITCRDVFAALTRDQMLKILCQAGVNISHEEFEKVWKKAQEMDPGGKERVSYQTFREALHISRDEENKMYGYSEEQKIQDCCHGENPDVCCRCQCIRRNKNHVCPDI